MQNNNDIKRKPGFERILKTLYCQEPDFVPVAELSIDREIKEKFLGRPVRDASAYVTGHNLVVDGGWTIW